MKAYNSSFPNFSFQIFLLEIAEKKTPFSEILFDSRIDLYKVQFQILVPPKLRQSILWEIRRLKIPPPPGKIWDDVVVTEIN
jgi:hypothetical protein